MFILFENKNLTQCVLCREIEIYESGLTIVFVRLRVLDRTKKGTMAPDLNKKLEDEVEKYRQTQTGKRIVFR